MKVSICIPAYNESGIILQTLKTLDRALSKQYDDYEIIVSNDGSTDGTAEIVKKCGIPSVRLSGYEKNRGKGCAVRTGILDARGDIIIFTDSDLAYGTDYFKIITDKFESEKDTGIIVGSRSIAKDGYEGYTFTRKLASKLYLKTLLLYGGLKQSDSQCGIKAFRRDTAKKIFPLCEVDGFAFDFEILLLAKKLGVKVGEIPVRIINHRESKISLIRDTKRMLADLVKMKKRISKLKID
jgi:dolichyl-phosphate beta-glucosyltransferase